MDKEQSYLKKIVKEEVENIVNNFIAELEAANLNVSNEELLYKSKLIISRLITNIIRGNNIKFDGPAIYPLVFNLAIYNKKNSSIFNFEDFQKEKGEYLIDSSKNSQEILNKLISLENNINECILLEKVFVDISLLKSLLITQIKIEFLNTLDDLIEERV